jgi:hypothetical protein
VTAARHDPAARRRRLDLRVSVLKRRFGLASILGFGTLLGLVGQHTVGTQKQSGSVSRQPSSVSRRASTFFDATGSGYSFDDSSVRAAQQSSAAASSQPVQQPAPVAQSSGS